VTWAAAALMSSGCAVATMALITTETGLIGLAVGLVLAALPVFPVVAAFLWLDRYETEPPSLLAFAMAWGAGVATLGALEINTASVEAIRDSGGDPTVGALFVAPVVEEALKGLAVLLIVLLRRREFDGIVDGIVYAGFTGIGFAFVENVLYLGRSFVQDGGSGAVLVFVLRCLASPFAHPLFTAATGIGLGLAVRSARPAVRVWAPVLGFAIAVSMHVLWNLSAASGLDGFVSGYVVFQVPLFLGFVLVAVLARGREGRLIARHLSAYGATGWLSAAEVAMLASLSGRRAARRWAARSGGPGALRAMRDFQDVGSELAFLRERMIHGTAPPQARALERSALSSLSDLRAGFTRPHRADGTPG
jgi:RsiW-degrading membrane proteinase PrsW (M82 family)